MSTAFADLFIPSDLEFAKVASETELPEDPNAWPQEILQELYKQVPYVADFQPHVQMTRVDAERGYGLGQVIVGNQTEASARATADQLEEAGIRHVRIPVIVSDNKLQPFDLLVTDDAKVCPLTEARLRQAMFRPQAFDVSSKTPGDMSMVGQVYPPIRRNYGGAGGGFMADAGSKQASSMEKAASAFEEVFFAEDAGPEQASDTEKAASAFEEALTKHLELNDPGFRRPGEHIKSAFLREVGPEGEEKNAGYQRYRRVMRAYRKAGGAKGAPQELRDAANTAHSKWTQRLSQRVAKTKKKERLRAMHDRSLGRQPLGLKKELLGMPLSGGLGAGGGKTFKTSSVLEAILPTINRSDWEYFTSKVTEGELMQAAFTKNASSHAALRLLLRADPGGAELTRKVAFAVPPNVLQLTRLPDGYRSKTASTLAWAPKTELLDRGEALRKHGEKLVLAADLEGAVTSTDTEGAAEEMDTDMQDVGSVTSPGLYKVQTSEGKELVGYVFPNLLDVDGTPVPLALFTNGSESAIQGDIVGVPAGEGVEIPSSDDIGGFGAFVSPAGDDRQSTVPMELSGSYTGAEEGSMQTYPGETFDGRQVEVSVQPNIQTVVGTPEGKMLVPEGWKWMPLESSGLIELVSTEEDVDKQAHAHHLLECVVIKGSGDVFALEGLPIEKLASSEKNDLTLDDAMFVLAGLGVNQAYGIKKLAEASLGYSVQVKAGRPIQTELELQKEAGDAARQYLRHIPNLRQDLIKEASSIPDPMAVDTVLSLGFINPENISTFVSSLPTLDEAQRRMCELLLAARLGMNNIPVSALERAVRSTEEVIEGLKTLAFQQG